MKWGYLKILHPRVFLGMGVLGNFGSKLRQKKIDTAHKNFEL